MLYARRAGETVRPLVSSERAECPFCGTEMVAHVGTRRIPYWAHVSLAECDTWAESFGTAEGHQWHLGWQDVVNLEHGQIEVSMTVKGVRHQADIVAADKTVIEVQRSQISAADIREREEFYGRMVWIWEACRAYREERLCVADGENLVEGDWRSFTWTRSRPSIQDCQRPVFLDMGNGWLLQVAEFVDGSPVTGEAMLVSRERMIHWITHGPPEESAGELLLKRREAERARLELAEARKREARKVAEQERLKRLYETQRQQRERAASEREQRRIEQLRAEEERRRLEAARQEAVRGERERAALERDRLKARWDVEAKQRVEARETALRAIATAREERERLARICNYWEGDQRCGVTENTRPFIPGPRCPLHTPAALAGRDEPPSRPLLRRN